MMENQTMSFMKRPEMIWKSIQLIESTSYINNFLSKLKKARKQMNSQSLLKFRQKIHLRENDQSWPSQESQKRKLLLWWNERRMILEGGLVSKLQLEKERSKRWVKKNLILKRPKLMIKNHSNSKSVMTENRNLNSILKIQTNQPLL